jgi:hypothetical protein
MNLAEKLARSHSSERINFGAITCLNETDPLVPIPQFDHIIVEPIWTVPGDMEGRLYARYIETHPAYDTIYVRSELLQRLKKAVNSLENRATGKNVEVFRPFYPCYLLVN